MPSVGEGPEKTTMVGRFGPRSRVHNGDVVNVAVDTGSVHLFDAETGDAIYAQEPASAGTTRIQQREGAEA